MFKKQTVDNTEKNKILSEGKLMDNLCELAVERHFQQFFKTASKFRFSNESTDQITLIVCEALVKDLENEIWQRIAPKMSDRVVKMRELAMEATGGHTHI